MAIITTKHREFQDVVDTMDRLETATYSGPVKAGRVRVGYSDLNSALVITLDKAAYSRMLGRFAEYRNIPVAGKFVFESLRPTLLNIMIRHYDKEEEPNGTKWRELADSTKRWRKMMGVGEEHPILKVTDELYDGLVAARDMRFGFEGTVGRNPRMVISAEDIIENPQNRTKFYVHNLGIRGMMVEPGSRPKVLVGPWRVPPRPFILDDIGDLSPSERQETQTAARAGFNDYLNTLLPESRKRARKRLRTGR